MMNNIKMQNLSFRYSNFITKIYNYQFNKILQFNITNINNNFYKQYKRLININIITYSLRNKQ